MRIISLSLLVVVVFAQTSLALIQEGGLGIVYGSNYTFSLKAPKGWMLDTVSAVEQGLHAVFYPVGSSWQDSAVVAYARSRPRTEEMSSVEDVVKDLVATFHRKGSPDYVAKKHKTITADSGKKGEMYMFSGDKWGNSEAVVYFLEDKTINFVVFNSRTAADFEKFLGSFEELASSYIYIGAKPLEN